MLNAVENAQRRTLTNYELAKRALMMSSRFGTSHAEYARRLGLSESRVQNLVRYLERLPADILEAWRAGDPLLNDHMLQKLTAMPHDEASGCWATGRAARAAAPLGRRDRLRPRRSENRPTGATVSRLWVAVKRADRLDEGTRDVALKILEFCLGHAVTVPGLFDPRAPGPRRVGRKTGTARKGAEADRESRELPLPEPQWRVAPLRSLMLAERRVGPRQRAKTQTDRTAACVALVAGAGTALYDCDGAPCQHRLARSSELGTELIQVDDRGPSVVGFPGRVVLLQVGVEEVAPHSPNVREFAGAPVQSGVWQAGFLDRRPHAWAAVVSVDPA